MASVAGTPEVHMDVDDGLVDIASYQAVRGIPKKGLCLVCINL